MHTYNHIAAIHFLQLLMFYVRKKFQLIFIHLQRYGNLILKTKCLMIVTHLRHSPYSSYFTHIPYYITYFFYIQCCIPIYLKVRCGSNILPINNMSEVALSFRSMFEKENAGMHDLIVNTHICMALRSQFVCPSLSKKQVKNKH